MSKAIEFLKLNISQSLKIKILTAFYSRFFLRDLFFLYSKKIKWNRTMRFYGLPIIKNRGKIFIGKRFICCSDSRYNSIGLIQKVVIKSLRPNSVIKIGENTQISGCTISAASSIEIGNNVLVGSGVLITDGDSHPIDPNDRLKGGPGVVKGIKIHDNVFIGARAIILKGIEIGENSVIGAGSVVSKNIPANSLYAGNPCKFIKKL